MAAGYLVAGAILGVSFYVLAEIIDQVLEERRARRRRPQ